MIRRRKNWESISVEYETTEDGHSDRKRQNKRQLCCGLTKRQLVRILVVSLAVLGLSSLLFPKNGAKRIDGALSSLDAIVTVAMCGFHATKMVEALRNEGGWEGPIYVVTDTPETEECEKCTLINVRGHYPHFSQQEELDEYKAAIHEFKVEIFSKWQKTRLFDLLPPDDKVNTLLFLDADMFAQRSLSEEWLSGIEPILQKSECHIGLYPERWYVSLPIVGKNNITLSGKYNSGMMLQKRIESAAVLKRWEELMVHAPFVGRDQGKLTQAIEETEASVCHLPNHFAHVQNEADLVDTLWFGLFHGAATFRHTASAKMKRKKRLGASGDATPPKPACQYSNLEQMQIT